jgi:galactokinase
MRLFQAPGRANLIGDHIDYMGGIVLPMAIDRGTWLWVEGRDDDLIRGSSVNFPEFGTIQASIDQPSYDEESGWLNYLVAMVYALRKRGEEIPHGFDVRVRGDIPNGAGLSSSASLELAFGVALNTWFDLRLTPTELAVAGQVAENGFIGVSSGIMDQLIIANGRRGFALAMDCESLEVSPVPMPEDDVVIVADTRKRRGLVESAYNQRRAAAEEAERQLGGGRLVEIPPAELAEALERIDPAMRGPARHVASEQHRVLAAVAALQLGDDERMGELMRQSHESLRDDYKVTGVELDTMVETAWEAPGCLGARMTGAGFGGCTVNLVQADAAEEFVEFVGPRYSKATGLEPRFFVVRPDEGAREITDAGELAANQAPAWGDA